MPAAKCGGCAKYLSPLGAATCSICKTPFHRACGALPSSGSVATSWSCSACAQKSLKSVIVDSAPKMDNLNQEPTTKFPGDENLGAEILNVLQSFKGELRGELRHMFKEEFVMFKNELLDELQRLRTDLNKLQTDRDQLKLSCDCLKERLDIMDTRMAAYEQKLMGPSEAINEVAQLRQELNHRDQQLLSNDLEISNLPENSTESLTHTVKLIATKLGVRLDDRDIVSADRAGGRRVNATSAAGAVESRPRPIVVRFARRDLRDELMRAARVRRGANTSDLGLPGQTRRFYLNERLTKSNRLLFRRAREAGQRLAWKFVWTKHGRILARQYADDKAVIIRSETDLQHIFGPDA
ncbi:uncharacterized protein LOC119188660 [Manduca sexta]|uniref:uncharacterized protein LOC119188660 n=1 Tax=Manduca sexta TaxID=7130 RepID=UPI0018909E21|nr:uncharacterized protein LOC119188660 [Manduca sexta]